MQGDAKVVVSVSGEKTWSAEVLSPRFGSRRGGGQRTKCHMGLSSDLRDSPTELSLSMPRGSERPFEPSLALCRWIMELSEDGRPSATSQRIQEIAAEAARELFDGLKMPPTGCAPGVEAAASAISVQAARGGMSRSLSAAQAE